MKNQNSKQMIKGAKKFNWVVGIHKPFVKERLWSKTTVEIAGEIGVSVYSLHGFMRSVGLRKRDFGGLKKLYPVLCENPKCGKVFRSRTKGRRYCGRSCAMSHYIAINGVAKHKKLTKQNTDL